MRKKAANLVAALIREQNGQTIVMFGLMLVVLLAIGGFVIDIGRAMIADNALKSGTIAAALAGANEMPNSDYVTVAQNYSSIDEYNAQTKITTTGKNTEANLPGVQTSATGYCSSFVSNTLDVHCVNMGTSSVNALVVTQTVTVPMDFMQIMGIDSITFSSTETAAWKGAARNPYNVAVIVDTTGSMNSVDSGSEAPCNGLTRIACSLIGVQELLENLTPCSGGGSCGSGTIAQDEVALYTFPGLSTSTAVSDEVNCTAQIQPASASSDGGFGETDSTVYWNFPGSTFTGSALLPSPPYYQLVGFANDYKSSDNTSSLSGTSTLVKAVGGASTPTCQYLTSGTYYKQYGGSGTWAGLQAAGGADTYYAGVIYQAQNDLYNQYKARLNPTSGTGLQTSDVMVVLSDGDVNATSSYLGGEVVSNGSPVCQQTNRNGQCTSYVKANSNSTGTYPSYEHMCQQAITAAQDATNGTYPTSQSTTSPIKTTVYSVAYGSASSGCSTDTGLSPCTTMEQMASSYITNSNEPTQDFYSDYAATGGTSSCTSHANSTTSIPAIFQEIAATLSASKIMANPSGCTASNTSACN